MEKELFAKIRDIMTPDPACCTKDTPLQEVARQMLEQDCGAIPVVDEETRPVGIVTDRDITVRCVARGINPLESTAGDCMSEGCISVSEDASLEECIEKMEDSQVRRVLVLDGEGCLCGIVSQADIALNAPEVTAAEVLEEVSQPSR